jgi:hypothetical protein
MQAWPLLALLLQQCSYDRWEQFNSNFLPRQQVPLFTSTSKMLTKSHVCLHHAPARFRKTSAQAISLQHSSVSTSDIFKTMPW